MSIKAGSVKKAIQIKYSCKGCKLALQVVTVEARTDMGENVVAWMTRVINPAVSNDHATRSPFCRHDKFDLMIPLSSEGGLQAKFVGGIPE